MSLIEDFAAGLGRWVPDLKGRTFAVSEVDVITKDNMPSLPFGVVGMINQTFADFPSVITQFVVEVALEPVRATTDGCETPFWAYYDFEGIRDAIFVGMSEIEEKYGRITPVQMEVDPSRLVVYLSIRFTITSRWCAPEAFDECAPRIGDSGPLFRVVVGPVEPPCIEEHPPECRCKECWMNKEASNG